MCKRHLGKKLQDTYELSKWQDLCQFSRQSIFYAISRASKET